MYDAAFPGMERRSLPLILISLEIKSLTVVRTFLHFTSLHNYRYCIVSFGFVGVLLGIFIFIIALGSLIQFLQTPTGLVTLIVIIVTIVVAFMLTRR
jgi:hypothetical protein